MTTFAVQYVFDRDEDARMEARPRHRAHLQKLYAAGKILQAGPFADGEGSMVVYDVGSRAELDDLLAADPYFADGPVVSLGGVREWELLPFE